MNPDGNASMAELADLFQGLQFVPFTGDPTSMYSQYSHQVSYYQSEMNASSMTTYYSPNMDPQAYATESGGNAGQPTVDSAQGYIPGSHSFEGVPLMGCCGGIHTSSQLPTGPIFYLPSYTYRPCAPFSGGMTFDYTRYPPSYSYAPSAPSPMVFRPPPATMPTPARASRSSAARPTPTRAPRGTPAILPSPRKAKFCKFCRSNNETAEYYTSHNLSEDGKCACPVLRRHVCEICGQTGDKAHTKKYCPFKVTSDGDADDEDDGDGDNGGRDESSKKQGGEKRVRFNCATGHSAAGGYSRSKF